MSDAADSLRKGVRLSGFQGVSLVDYPGRVSSVLFLGGCNFRCPFCHNADLVLRPDSLPVLDVDEILSQVAERRSLVDGVVVTGGEPLVQGERLLSLLKALHDTGVAVKLDTNGYEIDMLRRALGSGLVDYVAMDVKTSPGRYSAAAGRAVEAERVRRAIGIVKSSGVKHEFRTTCVPGIVDLDDILEIAALLGPNGPYFLQQFRASGGTIDYAFAAAPSYPAARLREFATRAENLVRPVSLRGC